MYFIGFL